MKYLLNHFSIFLIEIHNEIPFDVPFEYILKSLYTNIDADKDNDDQGGGTDVATSSTWKKRLKDSDTHTNNLQKQVALM